MYKLFFIAIIISNNVYSSGGVVFTFDDRTSIHSWYDSYSSLSSLGFKATFYVDGYTLLDKLELFKVQQLKSFGNEFGVHGRTHYGASIYTRKFGFDNYFKQEVFPEIKFGCENFLSLNTFAYPAGDNSEETNSKLLNLFDIVRDVEGRKVKVQDQLSFFNPEVLMITAIGIDEQYPHVKSKYYEELLAFAHENNKIIIFYGHAIESAKVAIKSKYNSTSISVIKSILKYANINDMSIMMMSDLVGKSKSISKKDRSLKRDGTLCSAF
jgi:hypothetical protein